LFIIILLEQTWARFLVLSDTRDGKGYPLQLVYHGSDMDDDEGDDEIADA